MLDVRYDAHALARLAPRRGAGKLMAPRRSAPQAERAA